MKRMKLFALVIAGLMLLSACNAVNVTEVATIGDDSLQKPEFMYYLQMGKNQTMQEAAAKGLAIATDADWNKVMIDDKTAAQYAKDMALQNVKTIMVLDAKAMEAGYVLTDADMAEIASQKEQLIEQLGGRYGYEQSLSEMGISVEALDTIVERNVYANAYMASISEEADFMEPTDEEVQAKYNGEYVYVRHILISNQAPEEAAENAEDVDYDAKAKEEAEGILEQIKQGANFVTLMNQYSDDGRDENGKLASDGYVMTDNGQMVKEFEDAAMQLEIGAYTTELVKTDYGYHILMRYALPTSGDNYDAAIATIEGELKSEKLEAQVNTWADELGFAVNQKYFDRLKVKMEG